jgi:hypothetical protein
MKRATIYALHKIMLELIVNGVKNSCNMQGAYEET